MNAFQAAFLLLALCDLAVLMTGCTNPGYNDNPSQQVTTPSVGCPAATDFFALYFSVHIQPAADDPNAKLTKEIFRSYCEDVPAAGTVFFTADLVGNELRRLPIGIRLVEQEFAGYDIHLKATYNDLRLLSEVAPRPYPKGVIETRFDIDKNGHYAIYLDRDGRNAVTADDTLRIPLNVGVESGSTQWLARLVSLLAIAAALTLIGLSAWSYRERRKTR